MESKIFSIIKNRKILLIFFCLINLFCKNTENNLIKKIDFQDSISDSYSNFKRTTYEKAKETFDKNEREILNFTLKFENQQAIERISREDYTLLETDSSFKRLFPDIISELSYSIKLINSKSITILIEDKFKINEDEFWKQEFSEIRTSEKNQNLKDFLDQNNISVNYFKECLDFFKKFNFFSIRKIINTNIIEIRIRISDGLIYNPLNINNPESDLFIETKPLNSKWIYFTEYKKY